MTEQTTDSTPGNAKKLKQLTQFLHRLYYTLINKSKFKCPFWRDNIQSVRAGSQSLKQQMPYEDFSVQKNKRNRKWHINIAKTWVSQISRAKRNNIYIYIHHPFCSHHITFNNHIALSISQWSKLDKDEEGTRV